MKNFTKTLAVLAIVLLAALIFPTSVQAAVPEDGRTIFGESFTLNSGEILDGDLNVFGGVVQIMDGATVTGDLLVIGGVVTVDGTIQGNLTAVGGTVSLTNSAVIQGDLVSPGSYVNTDEGAAIQGDIIQGWIFPDANIEIPDTPAPQINTPSHNIFTVFTRIAREVGQLLAMVALGALLLLIIPKPVDVMTQSLRAQPWTMLGFGALTAIVMVFGGVILALTICLAPVVILAGLAFGLAILAGWLMMGYELGKQMASSIFKTTWHPVLAAVLGNLVLYILARSLWAIPCLGWTIVTLVALFGLGTAMVTLIGTNPYPRTAGPATPEQEIISLADNDKFVEETEDAPQDNDQD